jgi:hypothetical protein
MILRTTHRVLEALPVERFQKVIDLVQLERLERVLIVHGDKNYGRSMTFAKRLQYSKAVQLRNLDIKENQVRALCSNGLDGISTAGTLRNHRHIRIALEHLPDPLSCLHLPINNYCPHTSRSGHCQTLFNLLRFGPPRRLESSCGRLPVCEYL